MQYMTVLEPTSRSMGVQQAQCNHCRLQNLILWIESHVGVASISTGPLDIKFDLQTNQCHDKSNIKTILHEGPSLDIIAIY